MLISLPSFAAQFEQSFFFGSFNETKFYIE